jgi:hypothetical protein
MKQHRLVSKTPQTSQTSGNFQAKVDFKVDFSAQVVQVVFNKTS